MHPPWQARTLLMQLIRAYQTHLSPIKGYGCAYRVRQCRGSGCSGVGLRAIRRHGCIQGLLMLRQRLQRCSNAAHEMRQPHPSRQRMLATQRGECDPGCVDCADLTQACDCSSHKLEQRLNRWFDSQPRCLRWMLLAAMVGLTVLIIWYAYTSH